jgi:hypothetical protein
MPVNVSMERTLQMGAARAARFSSAKVSSLAAAALATILVGAPPAQQDPTTLPGYRLAQAKLAEARGDVAAARRTLEEALAKASEADQVTLREALAALPQDGSVAAVDERTLRKLLDDPMAAARFRELLQQRGFPAAATQDPVQRRIAVLDEGTSEVKAVDVAMSQLSQLGTLAVSPLLEALPKVGPFGLVNVLSLLQIQNDSRIAPALLERANRDPAFAVLIVDRLQHMADAVRLGLVAGFDATKLPPAVQMQFAEVMGDVNGMDERRHALALRLADEPTLQEDLCYRLGRWQVPWADAVFAKLRASQDPATAAQATAQWLLLQKDLDEASALAMIQQLDPRYRGSVARQVTTRAKHWAKVALLGLGEGANHKDLHKEAWFHNVLWRHGGGDAATALLQLTKAQPDALEVIVPQVLRIVEDGWILPREWDATLGSYNASVLATALPKDDEARALAAWQGLGSDVRSFFVDTSINLGRAWHRVVAAQLAAAQHYDGVQAGWLRRDWTGAPPEVGAALVVLAERFLAMPVGHAERPQRTVGGPVDWTGCLIEACRRHHELPSAILLPLVRAGNPVAWEALVQRDPGAALAIARAPDNRWHQGLPGLLGEHGTAGDVPTLVQLLGWHGLTEYEVEQVRPFVLRHGLGNVALLQRAAKSKPGAKLGPAIAAKLVRAQLATFLAALPELPSDLAKFATEVLQPQLGAADAAMLVQALEHAVDREPRSDVELQCVVQLMTRVAAPECLPALRRFVARERAGAWRGVAAAAMIACAGAERRAVLLELLASGAVDAVAAALAAPDVGQDQELLAAATKALLANLRSLGDVEGFFQALEPRSRATTAGAVLHAADFDQCASAFAASCLRALGDLKVSQLASDLARGTQHPNAQVRRVATHQLGRLFARDAAPFLLEQLKDDDDEVRKIAKQSLELLADYLDGRAKWEERLRGK